MTWPARDSTLRPARLNRTLFVLESSASVGESETTVLQSEKRVEGQREVLLVMCCQDWTNFGALAVGMDDDRALVHSLHKPVRQLLFQSSVKFNLRSAGHIFSLSYKNTGIHHHLFLI